MIRFALVLAILVVGCGGRASGTRASGSGTESGSSAGAKIAGGSASGSESGNEDGNILDAEVPDAFPATCTQYTFVLEPDAAANMCAFTPADVACNSNSDCTTYVKVGCGCFDPIYGVNTKNTVKCFAPPCGAQLDADGGLYTCPSDVSGLYTQACQFVPDSLSVAVACINHQCLTYAATPGSE